ncbi:MAG: tRNA 2-thiocytidine(32) synthetase TtcA [Ruminococcaceae bacterium]|nr:tRNA 2-thiocytidine(32) synthetase TtcA [Oscillospiraceae bacterium]
MEFQRIRRLLSFTRRAVDDYNMIEEGDRIAVGVSGGKDSLALLCALSDLRRFYPKKFELVAITVAAGFPDMDFAPVKEFCESLKIPYIVKESGIANVVFNIRKESNPCSLCAKMRRGSLHDAAKEAGCNKLALGHHFDDAITTFMLNLFKEGRIGCFSPVTYLSRKDLTMIRPLLYAKEDDIAYFVRGNELPIVKNTCPEDKNTERESMKQFIDGLDRKDKGLKHRIFTAMQKGNVDGFKLP